MSVTGWGEGEEEEEEEEEGKEMGEEEEEEQEQVYAFTVNMERSSGNQWRRVNIQEIMRVWLK